MTVYIIHILEILISGIIIQPNKSKQRKTLYTFLQCLIIVVLYTIRSYSVGRDTRQFVIAFNVLNGHSAAGVYYSRDLEVGFEWLCKSVGLFSSDYHILFLVIAVFLFGVLSAFIFRNSKDIEMSYFLFATMTYMSFMFSSMRQAIAIGFIVLFSEIGLKRNRYILFGIGVFFASLFHSSALIAIVIIVFTRIEFNKKYLMLIAASCILLPLVADLLYRIATRFLPYAVYIGTQYYNSSLLGAIFSFFTWAFMFSFASWIWLYKKEGINNKNEYKRIEQKETKHFWNELMKGKLLIHPGSHTNEYSPDFLLWCGTASVAIAALSLRISVVSRAIYYFGIYSIIMLPNSVAIIARGRQRQQIRLFIIAIGFIIWYIIAAFRPEWYNAVPYVTDLF